VLQSVPTGAYEKPYSLLIQRDFEPRESVARAPQAPLADGRQASATRRTTPCTSRRCRASPTPACAFRRRARLLLLGEPGVGKTAIARHIHRAAGWGDRPFIT
jgi:DNA-binding NtrC family response regulator